MGLGLGLPFGMPGIGQDNFFRDTGMLPQTDSEQDIDGKSTKKAVKGDWQEKGDTRYIEVRLPTRVGERVKTPYQKLLPKYGKVAEEALDKKKVPKEHEGRVRDYFNSLQGGGK